MTTVVRTTRTRLTANLFAIPFGVCGVAQCWSIAAQVSAVPSWPANALWVVGAALWLALLIGYLLQLRNGRTVTSELADVTFGPFVPVAVIIPMLLGGALARHAHGAGQAVFLVALVATLLAGGWLSGQWILADTALAAWHPGYFLPTVAGGLIASAMSAGLGYRSLAQFLFGYGLICWLVLGSIVLARLFTQPRVPAALTATIAIEVAPPAIAGLAWFAMNGGRVDPVALGLAGYALLMVMVQVRLVPLYRTIAFGPSWWTFSFPYAAVVAYAIRWMAVEQVVGRTGWIWALLAVVTAAVVMLLARTALEISQGRFLPRPSIDAAQHSAAGTAPDLPPRRLERTAVAD